MRRFVQCLLFLPLLLAGFPATVAKTAETTATPITFNVTVSLEWQPGTSDLVQQDLLTSQCGSTASAGGNYLNELVSGLNKASDYLALYTNSQMRLGTVTIYTGGANWSSANIRVLADSSYRPKAFVGGIVSAPMTYASPHTGLSQTFYPGAIHLGRLWDGTGARCGGWSMSDGYRTIGHEWAHYALYLYDEYYRQHDLSPTYCTTSGRHLPGIPASDPDIYKTDSLMAYHYRAGQVWHGGAHGGTCDNTPQMWVHGESDWDTVARFYPSVVPFASPSPVASVPLSVSISGVSTLPLHSSANVKVRNLILPGRQLSGAGYMVRMNSTGSPQRIIGQGSIATDEAAPLPFLGVEDPAKDRAVVVMYDHTGAHFVADSDAAPLTIGQTSLNELPLQRTSWKPCMSITPTITTSGSSSQVTQLTVRLRDCAGMTGSVRLAYCPSGGNCQPLVTPVLSGGSFVHTFNFPGGAGLTEYGYIYARSADTGEAAEETIAWYQLAGGVGPATITGHAPLMERTVDPSADLTAMAIAGASAKSDSYLLYSSAIPTNLSPTAALPTNVAGLIDTPIDVQPVAAYGNSSLTWSGTRYDPALALRLSYNQDLLNRLRISEERLVVLRLEQGVWKPIQTRQRGAALDWIAIGPQAFNGNGATLALGYFK
ncbi:MAG: hypothetical protein JOZ51_17280 [Chloroflexi bacterium]|nr:hypothetical protein [Chloroflexota bacterium]